MSRLYSNPLRVYLLLGFIALTGIYCGYKLPVSLFPNSSKPQIEIGLHYGGSSAEEFLNTYGRSIESQLKKISASDVSVEKIESTYLPQRVYYQVHFNWGVDPEGAQREAERVVYSFLPRLNEESRNSLQIWTSGRNSGFFAASFYSDTRDLNSLYSLLEPLLTPRVSQVSTASDVGLHNPSKNEIRVELSPTAMASLGLLPRHVQNSIDAALRSMSAGSVMVDTNKIQIEMPRSMKTTEELSGIPIFTPSGQQIHLSDVARVQLGTRTMDSRSFKTSGAPSLILFAMPKPGSNVKEMSESLRKIVDEVAETLPPDIHYRILVDPSEFIRSAIKNVFIEVGLAALLAVVVLFLFIGSFRNVITAAIEIPLSMVLAFILMRLFGMNLNLISLGGLALSAGMNVDASVVVMENIFRHFERVKGPMDFRGRLKILLEAVREVQFPILASTVSSLVVFLPLTMTSDLSFAILGDLAKAVVFSHGFSAIVALILVPTVRLQLMGKEGAKVHHSPIEKFLHLLEAGYERGLRFFIKHSGVRWGTSLGLLATLGLLVWFVFPRLPKEVIGKPDTDWMTLNISTEGNTLLKQMEVQTEKAERDLLDQFGSKIIYTFVQVYSTNGGFIMARLKDKADMQGMWKEMEAKFSNTPLIRYNVSPWNPSELPIPDPAHMRLAIRGADPVATADAARQIHNLLESHHVFDRITTEPDVGLERDLFLRPHFGQWEAISKQGFQIYPSDIAEILRVATEGKQIGFFPVGSELTQMVMRYPQGFVSEVEDVGSFPLGLGKKIIPLKALATPTRREAPPRIFREDLREVFLLFGKQDRGNEGTKAVALQNAEETIREWRNSPLGRTAEKLGVTAAFEDPARDVNEAISQLEWSILFSILLILVTLLIQFGSVIEPLLVLVSIPLGFIGVLLSLYIFKSSLSLNAALGVILLNGIAVANSILLVDFIRLRVRSGLSPLRAALEGSKERLRPILITSLTTILGMVPIAIGAGEGGKILQPLGIAVAGGLWFSTILTLFLVPGLYVAYLERKYHVKERKRLRLFPMEPEPA